MMQFIVDYNDGGYDISVPQEADFNDLIQLVFSTGSTTGWFKMDSEASGPIIIPMTSIKSIRELK